MKTTELFTEEESNMKVENNSHVFQRIDIEYISLLKDYDEKTISQIISSNLKNNLKQATSSYIWEQQLSSQVDQISSRLVFQRAGLLKQTQLSQQTPQSNLAKQQYNRHSLLNDRLGKNLILAVLEADEKHKPVVTQDAIKRLTQVISRAKDNYQLHFDLGWLYLFYQNNYTQAEKYFEIAVQQASTRNSLFALFASRHLAKAHYLNGNYKKAEAVMTEVLNSTFNPDPEYQYEYARYLAAMGELKLASMYLEQTIEKLPIYYTQATLEPDFYSKGIISQLLQTYKEQTLIYIREQYTQTWQQSRLAKLELPEDLSTQQLIQESCEKYEAEIKKHPLVIVNNNREQVKQQLIKYSKEALLTELIDKETYYMKAIGIKRDAWKRINKSGGMLIHAASILLLGTLFVLAAKFVLVSLGLGTVFYFEEVTGRAFIGVLILGFLGSYLLKSQPFGIKKLFRKSLLFRDAMTMIHKM